MTDAPSCPISFGQFQVGRQWAKGDPRAHAGTLKDLIHSIPTAHDLPSVIRALNIMGHIITAINRSAPAVNNTHVEGEPDTVLNGHDNNPNYQHLDWIEEDRNYTDSEIVNPDNREQFIKIKTLTSVTFYNANTNYRLRYHGS